jgi:hypothetical protein
MIMGSRLLVTRYWIGLKNVTIRLSYPRNRESIGTRHRGTLFVCGTMIARLNELIANSRSRHVIFSCYENLTP